MELLETRRADPPGNAQRKRIEARFRACSGETFEIYFELEGAAAPISAEAGADALFLCGFALAHVRQEPYAQAEPVDARLRRHVAAAQREWRNWPGRPEPVELDAPERAPAPRLTSGPALALFSGGVDSFFTLLEPPEPDIVALSIEHADDVRKDIEGAFARLRELGAAAAGCGAKGAVGVVTNMMTADPRAHDLWATRVHGCFFSACAHLLSDSSGGAILSSTFSYGKLKAWGSHPLIDPLWSSSRLRMIHHGAAFTRAEKTAAVGRSKVARSALSVCETGRRADGVRLNCSTCVKCRRTMLNLLALGYAPEDAPAFDWTRFSLQGVSESFVRGPGEARLLGEISDLARANGREEIAAAIELSVRRSRPFMPLTEAERFVRRTFPGVLRHRSLLTKLRRRTLRLLGFPR